MKKSFSALVLLLACASCASAEDSKLEQVRKALNGKIPGVTPDMVTPSTAPGLYQIRKGSNFAYVTPDGRFLIEGDMIDLVTGDEVTELQRQGSRLSVLSQFGPDSVIEFAPKDPPKYWVTVFTDLDCGYCRKLHAEVDQYNAQGIGIRYLFYPRSGPHTESFRKAEQVWCSADRRVALTQAKRGAPLMAPDNCPNPIQRQYDAGDALGINATPMLVLQDGELVRGYLPAPALAARLAQKSGEKAAVKSPAKAAAKS
jgi:thiol:disulfide interchange protein DsbC